MTQWEMLNKIADASVHLFQVEQIKIWASILHYCLANWYDASFSIVCLQ